jgi:hypothetical protein
MQTFVEDSRFAHLTIEMRTELINSVSEKITSQYDVLARDMVTTVSNVLANLLSSCLQPKFENCVLVS